MDAEKRESDKRKIRNKGAQNNKGYLPAFLYDPSYQKALILIGLSLLISFLITPAFTFIKGPYLLGDVAECNIKAKRDITLEDEPATLKKREEAAKHAPVVYDLDENIPEQIQERMERAFQSMREAVKEGQRTGLVQELPLDRPSENVLPTDKPSPSQGSASPQHAPLKKKDLEALLGSEVTDNIFLQLYRKNFSRDLEEKASQLLKAAFEPGIMSNKATLQQVQGKNMLVRKVGSHEEFIFPPPHTCIDLKEARRLTRVQAQEQWQSTDEILAVASLVSRLLQPNLIFNLEETQRQKEIAYSSAQPIHIQVLKNEMLVREGQRIGPLELLKLRDHDAGRGEGQWFLVFVTMFLSSGLCIWVVVNVVGKHVVSFRMEVRDYVFLGIVLVVLLAFCRSTMWVGDLLGESSARLSARTFFYAIPISAGAMIASIFFGVTMSLIFSLLLTLFVGMLFGKDFGLFFYFLIGCYVAGHGVSPCRNRMVPIKAGLLVGCVNVILIVLNALLQDQLAFLGILANTFFGFCGGIFAGILVTGFTPLAEMALGYTTDIKLLELVTMDQPLLQGLMVQAPGTYHHSIIVGNMVEAAAKSIGANSLLAKVAAYYHDIGKIKKPLYFIENQLDCENRHEKLAPSMSGLILISHVKEGTELAKQRRLPREIIDIISQHHGTSLISFFYKKALEAREKALSSKGSLLPPINIDDYRYPGPKPQTKEAGLVMLADVVEAACRSLTEPTSSRIQGMVSRLINNIFSDGQLEECELTLKDLHHIAKHFNQILATVHHTRIEYPMGFNTNEAKGRTDVTDPSQRESKSDRDKSSANRESGRTDLKRLGIH